LNPATKRVASLKNNFSAMLSRVGTEVNQVICGFHDLRIMFDDQDRVAQSLQTF